MKQLRNIYPLIKKSSPLLLAGILVACGAQTPNGDADDAEQVESAEAAVTGTLTISGRISSTTSAPIAGVTVKLTGAASKTATTDATGLYTFTSLGAGSYTITPTKTGMKFCSASANLPTLRRDAREDFTGSTSGCQAPTYTKKALVLAFDPTVTASDGTSKKLSAAMGWDDSSELAIQYARAFQSITNGRVKYTIAKTTVLNAFPKKLDGFTYTASSYSSCMSNSASCHMPDDADYLKILNDNGVCAAVNAGTYDEIWLFGGPYFGYYESRLVGPNGYWLNSPPLTGSTCTRLVPIMGFNYERDLHEMVHDTMHRSESMMARVYGSWSQDRMAHNWDKFALDAYQSPAYGFSGCGNGHWTPTSTSEYDYANARTVDSYCDDFYNYPNLAANPASVKKPITCAAWGCESLGFYRWWYQHFPKASGTGPDGKFLDWWRYFMNANDVRLTDPATATCSSEYSSGWCQMTVDGVFGTCNSNEWATAGVATGWVKLTFPATRAVSSVTLYDRACDEQVTSGHIEFSDGSANVGFGALQNAGTTGTTVSFTSRSVAWIKVVIDSSTGTNPGIGEIVVK